MKKNIHFIGICGVAMSALAIAMKKKGHTVTGSDKGFYPPVSTYLQKADVSFYPGWHVDKMTANGNPDLVVVGNVAGSENPEWQYVQENKLPYVSYPELVAQEIVKDTSIVCAGTYGKTTSSTLLTWIFRHAGKKPSYMFGGISVDDMDAAAVDTGDVSILEGDEYKTARWDNRPKFAHYKPTHLLLTALIWDHADVYPTEASYIDAFRTMLNTIPETGLVLASENVAHLNEKDTKATFLRYGKNERNDYRYTNIQQTKDGMTWDIYHHGTVEHMESPLLGTYNVENLTGCFAMSVEYGTPVETIKKGITSFHGLKRRLEKRLDGNITVIDDIAHSPTKASSVLETVRDITKGKIIAIFEPNTGNREPAVALLYAHAFKDADRVIIPRLTAIKKDPGKPEPMDGEALASLLMETHENVSYIPDDELLIETLIRETKTDDVIVFLGSHGFRGMIEEVVHVLKQ